MSKMARIDCGPIVNFIIVRKKLDRYVMALRSVHCPFAPRRAALHLLPTEEQPSISSSVINDEIHSKRQ
jgi:hypothetical protein